MPGTYADVTSFTPFIYVVGTAAKDPAMRAAVFRIAQKQIDRWHQWQNVPPRWVRDTDLTDQQMRKYSLILIGGPDENTVTRRLIGQLPLKIVDQRVTIDGQAFEAPDAGVMLTYPHPTHDARYISVLAGTSAAGMLHVDRVPQMMDFAIIDGAIANDKVGRPAESMWIAAGRFDHHWRLDRTFLFVGDAKRRAAAPRVGTPTHLTTDVKGNALYLADVLETRSWGSFQDLRPNRNAAGGPIRIGGRTVKRGFGVACTDAVDAIEYDLVGGWKRLRATAQPRSTDAGWVEEMHLERTAIVFTVFGDDKELYRSKPLTLTDAAVELDVDLTNVKRLRLGVTYVQRRHAAKSANWANVRIER